MRFGEDRRPSASKRHSVPQTDISLLADSATLEPLAFFPYRSRGNPQYRVPKNRARLSWADMRNRGSASGGRFVKGENGI
jgi:hypothetical protein